MNDAGRHPQRPTEADGCSCCAPGPVAATMGPPVPSPTRIEPAPANPREHLSVPLPGGQYLRGDAFTEGYPADGELPVHRMAVSPFGIDATTVTNAEFAAFTEATGWVTTAEQSGVSAVFHLLVAAPAEDVLGAPEGLPWWRTVRGASWRHPRGAHSNWEEIPDHPVVQVSHTDALAYCRWAGRAPPSEAQWEYASRGGVEGRRFPWGDELLGADGWRCNIWQGDFPDHNQGEDGFIGTAPSKYFQPNDFGLYQTVGNVWEWCADAYSAREYARLARLAEAPLDPTGPERGNRKVLRGGSYLCHASYCYRYRNAARSVNFPDTTTGNIGFRTVSA